MGIKHLDDLNALKAAVAFKEEVYAIVRASPEANRDLKYRTQLFDAAGSIEGNIAEGWGRKGAGQMTLFLGYAIGSLEEARRRLLDGVARGYFPESICVKALEHARHCGGATVNLKRSLEPFIRRKPTRRKQARKPKPPD
ncbi:MAG: four helix bundle protein [Acidobacteria bacterium]|nr:four helix bundle protein [Acidobacteriota bacterium]